MLLPSAHLNFLGQKFFGRIAHLLLRLAHQSVFQKLVGLTESTTMINTNVVYQNHSYFKSMPFSSVGDGFVSFWIMEFTTTAASNSQSSASCELFMSSSHWLMLFKLTESQFFTISSPLPIMSATYSGKGIGGQCTFIALCMF